MHNPETHEDVIMCLTYENLGEIRRAIENYMDETPLPEPGK